MIKYINSYLKDTKKIISEIDPISLGLFISRLVKVKESGGRLFIIGNGGSAGTASHAVNDFRKICGIESYSPMDNVSELTARINDDNWDYSLVGYLTISNLTKNDALLTLSGSGGSFENKQSINLIQASSYANRQKAFTACITSGQGGWLAKNSDLAIRIPANKLMYAHVEGLTSVLLHLIVNSAELSED